VGKRPGGRIWNLRDRSTILICIFGRQVNMTGGGWDRTSLGSCPIVDVAICGGVEASGSAGKLLFIYLLPFKLQTKVAMNCEVLYER
jgi:hypothetical protein